MQYVRFYIDDAGVIMHTETSERPLRSVPAIEVINPIGLQPGMTLEQIRQLPTETIKYDIVELEVESTDGKFHRAREVMESVQVRKSDLRVSMKPATSRKFNGVIKNATVKRATRAQ